MGGYVARCGCRIVVVHGLITLESCSRHLDAKQRRTLEWVARRIARERQPSDVEENHESGQVRGLRRRERELQEDQGPHDGVS